MDPTDVLKALWQQCWYVLPALLIALTAAGYVYQFAPRSYESTATYALVNPAVPTLEELKADPALAALNADNPYLRSADANLVTDALLVQLNAKPTAETLKAAGVGAEYRAALGEGGNGFVVDITGIAATPDGAIATASAIGTILEQKLREQQKVNGADDLYLFTPLELAAPTSATEQFSSRLRSVIMVLIAGAVLVFAAASLGRFRGKHRMRKASRRAEAASARERAGAAESPVSESPHEVIRTPLPSTTDDDHPDQPRHPAATGARRSGLPTAKRRS